MARINSRAARSASIQFSGRKCQTADWKLRHKAACGIPLDFDTVSQPLVHPTSVRNADKRIGLPVNGYKRSLALVAQATALNQRLATDYQLYDRDGEPVNIDFIACSTEQQIFRAVREIAMTTGDRACVARLAHFLCWKFTCRTWAEDTGVTPDTVVAQLAREFVFDGLRAAVLEMQEIQHQDPLGRPPLLGDVSPEHWKGIKEKQEYSDITFD
ncbi:hypothetical protein DFH09DRAFT_1277142 [Mycena vulgaris]|nr:hypothetical protein DFH09DRAFT_1277142 [Mycena vulgaris]